MNMALNVFGAIIAGGAVATVLGFLWYSQMMFGKTWMLLMNISPEQMGPEKMKDMKQKMLLNILFSLITSLVLYIIVSLGFDFVGVVSLWLGFALPVYANAVLWEGRPWKLFYINAGYGLVSVVLVSEVLSWFI